MKGSRLYRFGRFIANALLVLFALGALGALLPQIPVLGEIGPLMISPFGPWITVLSLIGAVLVFRRWRTNAKRRTLVLAAMAAFACLGTLVVQMRQVSTAQANGASISLAEAFLAHSQSAPTPSPETVVVTRHDGQDLPLDIYRPTALKGAGPVPVVIYIHGGGWGGASLKQREADYRWFAARGYLAVSLEYTLSSDKRHTWNIAEPQLGCALAWLHANIARYGGDPARMALWGESAGGNLAINAAYRANAGKLESSCGGTIPQIKAMMALYPVVDPERMYHNPDPLIGGFGRIMTVNYTGGTPAQFPDRYAAIAGATHISAKAPPSLVIVPAADHLVVPEGAKAFAAKASAAGIKTRLIVMPHAEHSFDLRSGSIGNQMVRQIMLQWMQQHGLGAGGS